MAYSKQFINHGKPTKKETYQIRLQGEKKSKEYFASSSCKMWVDHLKGKIDGRKYDDLNRLAEIRWNLLVYQKAYEVLAQKENSEKELQERHAARHREIFPEEYQPKQGELF